MTKYVYYVNKFNNEKTYIIRYKGKCRKYTEKKHVKVIKHYLGFLKLSE